MVSMQPGFFSEPESCFAGTGKLPCRNRKAVLPELESCLSDPENFTELFLWYNGGEEFYIFQIL